MATACLLLVVAIASSALLPKHTARSTIVTFEPNAPEFAQTVDRSLISFSIEDRWPEWAGVHSPNIFFSNALNNLGAITGSMPGIRVGASTEDSTILKECVNVVDARFPQHSFTTPYPTASAVFVSSEYYQLSKRMPQGTHMIWGVNFASNCTSNAVAQVRAIVAAFASGGAADYSGVILDSIEIGSGADLYKYFGCRGSSYNITQYVEQWRAWAQDMIDGAGLRPNTSPRFLLASFAGSDHGAGGFSPQMLFSQGITSGALGQYMDTVSQHHYSGSFYSNPSIPLSDLMAKDYIRGNISQFDSDISTTVSYGFTYIFGEINSYSGHGVPGVSNAAGAATWALDYALQAATHRIRRVYFHEGIGFKYNLLQPVNLTRSITTGVNLTSPLAPHVQPQYYAAIVAATFIGNSNNNTITTGIIEVPVPNSHIAVYAAYDNGVLARSLVINSNPWLIGSAGSRGYTQLAFSVKGNGSASIRIPIRMQIRRLEIGHADDTGGLKFAGKSYETSTCLPDGNDTYATASLSEGLRVNDTEAVVLTFLY